MAVVVGLVVRVAGAGVVVAFADGVFGGESEGEGEGEAGGGGDVHCD